MTRYVAGRILSVLPVCLGISVLVFAMIHLVPGDPAIALVGPMHTPETLAKVRESLGLTSPVYVQYLRWLSRALRGDLGFSYTLNRPVLPEVLGRFRASLLLAAASFVIAVPLGIAGGIVAAIRRGSLLDRGIMFLTTIGLAFPPFYLGMLLIIVFSLQLRLLPSGGMFPVTGDATWSNVGVHLVLPALALAGAPLTVVARVVRTSTLEVLRSDYVRTAHAKGLKPNTVILRHVLVNAMVPVMSLIGLQIGYLLSATALVEVVFSWPGLGSMIVRSILTRDFPLTQGSVLLIALMYVAVNTATDLLQQVLDPRIRYG